MMARSEIMQAHCLGQPTATICIACAASCRSKQDLLPYPRQSTSYITTFCRPQSKLKSQLRSMSQKVLHIDPVLQLKDTKMHVSSQHSSSESHGFIRSCMKQFHLEFSSNLPHIYRISTNLMVCLDPCLPPLILVNFTTW
jgi:hypothetical protein